MKNGEQELQPASSFIGLTGVDGSLSQLLPLQHPPELKAVISPLSGTTGEQQGIRDKPDTKLTITIANNFTNANIVFF